MRPARRSRGFRNPARPGKRRSSDRAGSRHHCRRRGSPWRCSGPGFPPLRPPNHWWMRFHCRLKRVTAMADLNRERRLISMLTPGICAAGITVNRVNLCVSRPVSVEPPRASSRRLPSGSWKESPGISCFSSYSCSRARALPDMRCPRPASRMAIRVRKAIGPALAGKGERAGCAKDADP